MSEEFAKALVHAVARTAAATNAPQDGDYIGKDGLLYCGKCHTPKQLIKDIFGKPEKWPCMCRCRSEKLDREAAQKAMEYPNKLRERGGVSPDCRFENARMTPEIGKCKSYAERWDEAQRMNIGLFLWGDVGAGKTYAAHCICNALIDRKEPVPVFATSLSLVLNTGWDKSATVERIRNAPLVVFDDLGAERESEYALENIFMLVNERYRVKRPLIVTSNLTMDEMKNPVTKDPKTGQTFPDIRRKRIYDRVLEMCVPLHFAGASKRQEVRRTKQEAMREWLG